MSDQIDITYTTTGIEIGQKIAGIKDDSVTFNILMACGHCTKCVINIQQCLLEIYSDICCFIMDAVNCDQCNK